MVRKISVKSHPRKVKGKVYKVGTHKRINRRPLGKKIRYKDVGRFQVATDENGNFRGSRIIKNAKTADPKASSKEIIDEELKKLHSQYFNNEITYSDYFRKLNELER